MFRYETPWFYQDFKIENLCFLHVYLVHAARIMDLSTEIMLRPPKSETKHLYNSKNFPSCQSRYKSQIYHCFEDMIAAGCKF